MKIKLFLLNNLINIQIPITIDILDQYIVLILILLLIIIDYYYFILKLYFMFQYKKSFCKKIL